MQSQSQSRIDVESETRCQSKGEMWTQSQIRMDAESETRCQSSQMWMQRLAEPESDAESETIRVRV